MSNGQKDTLNEIYAKKFLKIRDSAALKCESLGKNVKKAKIVAAIVFLLFTVLAACLSRATGAVTFWLTLWIVLIFVLVFTFIIIDYKLHILKNKWIVYLNNDEQLDFDEEFEEDDDDEEDEEE